jgi:predicted DNA-binding protein
MKEVVKVSNRKATTLVRIDQSLKDNIDVLSKTESRHIGQQIKVMYEAYIDTLSSHKK